MLFKAVVGGAKDPPNRASGVLERPASGLLEGHGKEGLAELFQVGSVSNCSKFFRTSFIVSGYEVLGLW